MCTDVSLACCFVCADNSTTSKNHTEHTTDTDTDDESVLEPSAVPRDAKPMSSAHTEDTVEVNIINDFAYINMNKHKFNILFTIIWKYGNITGTSRTNC